MIAEKDNKNSDESTQSINSLYRERTHSVGLIVAPESGAYTVACIEREHILSGSLWPPSQVHTQ